MNEFFDFFKTTFLDEFQSAMTGERIASALLVSFFVSVMIALVYRFTYNGVSFNRNYVFSLILASMVTSVIIMTVTTNLTLSLGMVGALSIVRFRTAVKEPTDTVFMFWCISAGIMAGAGLIYASLIVNLSVAFLYILTCILVKKIKNYPYLVVVKYEKNAEEDVCHALDFFKKKKIKSRIIFDNAVETTFSVSLDEKNIKNIDLIGEIKGVISVAAVSYNGDTVL